MSGVDWVAFDRGLDAHQARRDDEAMEAAARSSLVAARPDADAVAATLLDLGVGDFFTIEGPDGRWVRCVKLAGAACYVRSQTQTCLAGHLSVLFEIPEPVRVSGETRYWIDEPFTTPIHIDKNTYPKEGA